MQNKSLLAVLMLTSCSYYIPSTEEPKQEVLLPKTATVGSLERLSRLETVVLEDIYVGEENQQIPEEKVKYINENVPLKDILANYKDLEGQKKITVYKSERKVVFSIGDKVLKAVPISLGFTPEGDKEIEGDGKTPEGEFYVVFKLGFGYRYYKGFQISYPNKEDAERGLENGLINKRQYQSIVNAIDNCKTPPQTTMLGSNIQFHGLGGGPGYGDWTLGCVGFRNEHADDLYDFSQAGCYKVKEREKTTLVPKTLIVINP